MKRSIKKVNEDKSTKTFNKKTLYGVLISICVALQVFFTIETSSLGAQIANLEEEYNLLTKQNRELEDRLIQSSSLIQLRQKAESLGFSNASTTYYIEKGETFASLSP